MSLLRLTTHPGARCPHPEPMSPLPVARRSHFCLSAATLHYKHHTSVPDALTAARSSGTGVAIIADISGKAGKGGQSDLFLPEMMLLKCV